VAVGAPPDATATGAGSSVPGQPAVDPRVALAAGLMPLHSAGIPGFLAGRPTYDGRGVLIAILDSGVDPGVYGLITTSTGAPKLLDVRDFSGEGRVALQPTAAGSDGTVTVGARRLRGAGRIARLATSDWFAGELRERPLGKVPAADLNGNGSNADVYPVVVVRATAGWVAFLDTNLDGSFEDESPLHDYREGRQTLALGTRPLSLAANFSEADGRPVLDLVFDTSAHGTSVAGVAAGHRLFNLPGFHGVAPGAQLIALKIANNARGGVTVHGSIMRALQHAARFAEQRALPLVVNLSFGVGNEREGRAAIDSLVDRFLRTHPRVVLTISAGNDGPGLSTVGFPGSADLALSVGSSYPGPFAQPTQPGRPPTPDVAGWWSSRGGETAKPDLLVPGVAYSVVPPWAVGKEIQGGTSFSAPYAAGLAACLMSALAQERRPIAAAEIVQALQTAGRPLPGASFADQGAGLPRLEAAYNWLVAGHQGSQYVVRAPSGGSGMLRRDGYAGPGDTLDVFRVRHALGLRAAQFRLRPDVRWLEVPRDVTASADATEITVVHRLGEARAPGVYVGTVSAYNPSDTLAGPLFRLATTVVVPHDLDARPLVDDGRRVFPGRVQRYFLRVTQPGTTLRLSVALAGQSAGEAIVRLFEPGGMPARGWPEDVGLGDEDPDSTALVVRADDFVPGVYELDVVTPSATAVAVNVRAERAPLAAAAAGAVVELSNAGPGSVTARVEQSDIGIERSLAVSGRGLPAETLAVTAPPWAERATVDVEVARDQWERFTDFALTVFDSTGEIVANLPQNYAFGRLAFAIPPERRGMGLLLELFPAYADPAERASWSARVRVRFLAERPEPAAGALETSTVAGGRAAVPWSAASALVPPVGYRRLVEVVARPSRVSGPAARLWAASPEP
jgi:subtilisin family serine protease